MGAEEAFLVYRDFGYDGIDIIGITTTKDKALELINVDKEDRDGIFGFVYTIDRYTLDSYYDYNISPVEVYREDKR